MKVKLLLIVCVMFSCFLLSGCWNYKEIRDNSYVSGIAIDKGEEKKYKLSSEIINFESSKDYKIKLMVIESEGDTIFEAIRSAISIASRKLYFGHCRIVIIGEDVAKEGLEEIIDIFIRNHEFRLTMNVFIAKGDKAGNLLKQKGFDSKVVSYEMEDLIKNDEKYLGQSENLQLYKVASVLLGEGQSLTLPALQKKKTEDIESFELAGIACFDKDKLVSYLEKDDAKYFLMLINQLKGGVLSVPFEDNQFIGLEIISSSSNYKFVDMGDKLALQLKTKLKCDLGENDLPIDAQVKLQELGKVISPWLKKQVEDCYIKVVTEMNSDIFGYESKLRMKDYKLWEKYKDQDILSIITLNVEIELQILNSGMSQPSKEPATNE